MSWHLSTERDLSKPLTRAERALLVSLKAGGTVIREQSHRKTSEGANRFHYVLVKASDGLSRYVPAQMVLSLMGRGLLAASGAQKVPTSVRLSEAGRQMIDKTDREGRFKRDSLADILRKETA